MTNIYTPYLAKIKKIIKETHDVKTFQLELVNPESKKKFNYQPGQFAEFSVFGVGESTFCLASTPTRPEVLECSVKKAGKVTSAIHELWEGDTVGIRGPYGNNFPVKQLKGKNLVFVGGGIGLAPLRSLINFVLDNRGDYGNICLVYGARTPGDLVYKKELEDWDKTPDFATHITVDKSAGNWKGTVGFVPVILGEVAPGAENAVAITCGPPIMIKFVVKELSELGFKAADIITTLEMKMKCGLGKCGRCNIGKVYVCKDGPVF